jgi:hypothetical protein
MKARSRLREAQEQRAEFDARYVASLKTQKHKPAEESRTPKAIGEAIARNFPNHVVRPLSTFNHSLKTKDEGKMRLAYAAHLFGKYSAPYHLQATWYSDLRKDNRYRSYEEVAANPNTVDPVAERRMWYVIVASGGSLYKERTKGFMTKKETHAFLNCSMKLTFDEAIWYALAKSHTSDVGVITRIYKSKLISKDYKTEFWRDVCRFFCVNPVPINKMNDLIDYITTARQENREWVIQGRTLSSLETGMEIWHRTLARARRMGNATWIGLDVSDDMIPDLEDKITGKKNSWRFVQIKTSKALAEEGSKMHHCVYSYQSQCISGKTSIWSVMVKPGKALDYERALTLEINNVDRNIVQIRGYANRLMRPYEEQALRQWARDNGLNIKRYGY